MQQEKPELFHYNNYRLFLKDTYCYLKSIDSKYSHRFIAQQVNASSCGWFSDIINNRINLTSKYLIKIAKLFKFNEKEQEYFKALVDYDQAGSFEEKELLYKKIISYNHKIKTTIIHQDQFSFFSKWYIPAIRELLLIFDFNDDYRSLGKKL
ncbi:MAG: TIGR02147 family protein, partial [Chitinivibrionales bacterium]|nr:TIGR02147 family protein [Chitinivibrionales bacterium]